MAHHPLLISVQGYRHKCVYSAAAASPPKLQVTALAAHLITVLRQVRDSLSIVASRSAKAMYEKHRLAAASCLHAMEQFLQCKGRYSDAAVLGITLLFFNEPEAPPTCHFVPSDHL